MSKIWLKLLKLTAIIGCKSCVFQFYKKYRKKYGKIYRKKYINIFPYFFPYFFSAFLDGRNSCINIINLKKSVRFFLVYSKTYNRNIHCLLSRKSNMYGVIVYFLRTSLFYNSTDILSTHLHRYVHTCTFKARNCNAHD